MKLVVRWHGRSRRARSKDRERDLLALILTSHGSPAGVAVQAGRRVEILSPAALPGLLGGAGVRHRACVARGAHIPRNAFTAVGLFWGDAVAEGAGDAAPLS
jgi:hypothetical protein